MRELKNKMPVREARKPTVLLDLPPEILSQTISYLPTARALRNISLTCRVLYEIAERDGWKEFVQCRFPSFHTPPQWKTAAHTLTTLSRNWDRKAFIAHHFEPVNTSVLHLPHSGIETLRGRWRRPQGQTMGFQPVIDSYEEWTGGDWTSREDVVAYGAGARLMLHNTAGWITYQDLIQHQEGRDDITTVNLLRPHQASGDWSGLKVVVGRASGDLKLVVIDPSSRSCSERRFATRGTLIRSADLSSSKSPLLAACLGDSRAVLYSTAGNERWMEPLSEVDCADKLQPSCRTWSARFLSDRRLAIGRGPSAQIVQVYDVSPEGLSSAPVRSFGAGKAAGKPQTSAYPLCSLPESSVASAASGSVFLSGGYDGCVRVHDMRSPADSEASIWDPTDTGSIFSLAFVGRERIVAGGAINALLKIFDVRMAGGRVYSYLDTNDMSARACGGDSDESSYRWKGSNVFTTSYENNAKSTRRREGGPVYSLSRPSSTSTSLYVGVEASVLQFNMTSMLDRHPDPRFSSSAVRRPHGDIDVQRTWDSDMQNKALNLSMYEQTKSGNMRLKVQGPVKFYKPSRSGTTDYDERWLEVGKGPL